MKEQEYTPEQIEILESEYHYQLMMYEHINNES